MSAVSPVAWPAVARVHADVAALFAESASLIPGVPRPRVTLDLPAGDPEPFHVFTLSTADSFAVEGALSNGTVKLSFDVQVVCVATGPTAEAAAEAANAYQALVMQVPLCDPLLGGCANEVGAPQVADHRVWQDADGRRHAGYRLAMNVSVNVSPSAEARAVIERIDNEP